ncbi:MAG: hypothetical protein II811_01315 [Spirochaetaceae bacterium]|nr:hypothetical protein [Spirochaetaceae bacterium]
MKLYSKHHLVCAAVASAVIGLIAGAALMNARNGEAYLEAPESTEQAVQTVSRTRRIATVRSKNLFRKR